MELGIELVAELNRVREANGKSAIPRSSSMCAVSTAKVHDSVDHAPHTPAECNLHSWSDQGSWTPCCYTSDHAQAACMWNKPRELTDYPGNGYEVAYAGQNSVEAAIAGWMNSPPHREVLLGEGMWSNQAWQAVGGDMHGGHAVLWFGHDSDPAGP